MDENKSRVDDDELNQMIAGLKGKQPSVTPPLVQDPVANPGPAIANDTASIADPAITPPAAEEVPAEPALPPAPELGALPIEPISPVIPQPVQLPQPAPAPVHVPNSNLDVIKQDAIAELRPLVDKLDLSPEDKFNTLLLIIRSTDDVSLLPAAHTAAKQITDDGRRAQALLDVIKEIDFFKQ